MPAFNKAKKPTNQRHKLKLARDQKTAVVIYIYNVNFTYIPKLLFSCD